MRRVLLGTAVGLAGLTTALVSPAWGEDAAPSSAGMVIHRDPATGKLGVPPPGAVQVPVAPSPTPGGALRAAPGPREVPADVPGGGWKVEGGSGVLLQSTTVTRDEDGRPVVDCVPGAHGAQD